MQKYVYCTEKFLEITHYTIQQEQGETKITLKHFGLDEPTTFLVQHKW